MRMKKNYLWILIPMLSIFLDIGSLYAQGTVVTGKIIDESDKTPIPGVNVMEKGKTTNGTLTDANGSYSLTLSSAADAVLMISSIGYTTMEIPVGGKSTVDISLTSELTELDEVVVVGYGTIEKREISSAVVAVNRDEFIQGAVTNPMDLLVGKVAGLTVNSTSAADPNAGLPSFQIRGATSLSAGNDPLIVINGVPGGNLRNVATQDIESMTVLKDGASSAIYGTRGANGVILITTKQGTTGSGDFNVTYDSWFGANVMRRKPRVLTADEFRDYRKNYVDYGGDTDWIGAISNDFSYDNNQYLGFSGAMGRGHYNASLNYVNAKGLEKGNEKWQYGAQFDMSQKWLNDLLEFRGSVTLRKVKQDLRGGNYGAMTTRNPTIPIYNDDGSYFHSADNATRTNPIETINETTNFNQRFYLRTSTGLTLNILRSKNQKLSTGGNFSYEWNPEDHRIYTPSTLTLINNTYAGRARLENNLDENRVFEWVNNYSLTVGQHHIKVLAGYSYQDFVREERMMENSNFPVDDFLWNSMQSGSFLPAGTATMTSNKTLSKLVAWFGRTNYSWKDGLLNASAVLRYEGSTKFGPNNKYGYFPGADASVDLTKLSFMNDVPTINNLKVRASYGVTGRQGFDPYQSMATYRQSGFYFINGVWVNGYEPSRNPNPNLQWERAITTNIGVDFSVLSNRIYGSIDYFDRQSKNLLYNYSAPQPPLIYNSILVNVGTIVNRGVEISLSGDIIKSDKLNWTSTVLFSKGKSFVKSLSNDVFGASFLQLYQKPGVGTTEFLFRYEEGGVIGRYYGYQHAGVSETGALQIYNKAGVPVNKGQETNDDKVYTGSGVPKGFFSFSNTVQYGRFDLNVLMTGAFGFQILNFGDYGNGFIANTTDNVLLKAYTERSDITGDPAFLTSFHLHNGTYLKLDNIALGYTTKFNSDYINKFRVFVAARNIATFSKYDGNDPSSVSVNGLTPGVDATGAYPVAVQLSVGVTANF
jgi:TonB-linked SusC/RagA family outer membrane protein